MTNLVVVKNLKLLTKKNVGYMWAVIRGEVEEVGTSQYVKLQHKSFILKDTGITWRQNDGRIVSGHKYSL